MAASDEAKARSAAMWSKRASQYAQEVHEGSAVMMPLINHITGIVTGKVGDAKATVLDLAAGSGEPSVTIASKLPHVDVVCTDFAPGMVAEAQRRAEARGLRNLRAQVADAENLAAHADASFDVVVCCAGLMMMDVPKALQEWRRVLKPGGLMVAAVWGPAGEETQIPTLYGDTMRKLAAMAPQPPPAAQREDQEKTAAKIGALGEDGVLAAITAAAGFHDIDVQQFSMPVKIAADALERSFIDSPVIGGLLDEIRNSGRPDISKEAMAVFKEVAAEHGLLTPEGGLNAPTNIAVVVTATA